MFNNNVNVIINKNAHALPYWPHLLCATILEKPMILEREVGSLFVNQASESAITDGSIEKPSMKLFNWS